MMDSTLQNLKFAVRSLRKSPTLTAAVVLTLALCIGATTAIFSVVYAVLFRPLPYADPDGLFLIRSTWRGLPGSFSAGNWAEMKRQDRVFAHLVPMYSQDFNLAGTDTPENVTGARVGGDFFALLGVQPALGRVFLPEEDQPGRGQVAVLSDGLWRRRFGGDPGVVGKEIRLDGRIYTVVGVLPASLDFTLFQEQLWVPAAFTPERLAMHDEHFITVLGRLRPGATLAQARLELAQIARWLRENHPKENEERGIEPRPLMGELVSDYRVRLFVLLGAVGAVLLIACANIANLLLARGAARVRETAIRAAIGAGRGHLIRHALTESLVLAAAGGVVGVLAAYWAVSALAAFGPADVPRLAQARVDGAVLLFALLLTLASGLVFGLAPALRVAGRLPHEALKAGGRTGSHGHTKDRLRNGLVVAEIGLALMLLTGAGLLIRSAVALNGVHPGFDPSGVLAARVSLPTMGYETPIQARQAFERIVERVGSVPGVESAAVVSTAPLEGGGTNGLVPEGRPLDIKSAINSDLRLVTPAYFATMGIRLVRGRTFTDEDRAGTPLVMVVNETLAREAFPDADPIGKRIACCESGPDGSPNWKVVIGVVTDVRANGLGQEPDPEFYLPMAQAPAPAWDWIQRTMTLAVRTRANPMALVGALRQSVREIDPAVPLHHVGTMDDRITDSLAQSRFSTALLGVFGGIALLLAAIGVYGVISYGVTQRTQEIGIRVALGAQRSDVVKMILRHGSQLAAIGLVIGLAGALLVTRLLETLLFRVSPTDPPTFAAGTLVLSVVAIGAALLPGLRAARVDPALALRSE
jgi:putative ABC transport system permease protein